MATRLYIEGSHRVLLEATRLSMRSYDQSSYEVLGSDLLPVAPRPEEKISYPWRSPTLISSFRHTWRLQLSDCS